jgi:hypothetical protein
MLARISQRIFKNRQSFNPDLPHSIKEVDELPIGSSIGVGIQE